MPGFLLTPIAFILVLGLLVFVHELGHFVVAKRAGIRVEEFGFGYPPRMLTLFKRDDTVYTLNWLPLGGFVRMVGENGEEESDPHSFASKSALWRAGVLVAGSFMNLVLPIFLFAFMALAIGVPDGPPTGRVAITGVEPGSPAAEAALQINDEILFVASQRVLSVSQLQGLVQQFEGREISVDVERNGEMEEILLSPRRLSDEGPVLIGVSIVDQREMVRYNPLQAIVFGFQQTFELLGLMLQGFGQMIAGLFNGSTDGTSVAGPLGIMQATGEVAQTGRLETMLSFIAFLSINLAIINMVPIPGLDGGRLLFVVIEALRGGKRISPEREGMVHLLGIMLLLALIAVVSIMDVQRLFSGASILQ